MLHLLCEFALQKFTAADTARWAELWHEAHATHDATFAARRTALATAAESVIVSGDDPALAAIVAEATAVGLRRATPPVKLKEPPPYPRGVVQSEMGRARWLPLAPEPPPVGKAAKEKAAAAKVKRRQLQQQFEAAWADAHAERSEELRRELRIALRRVDREHSRALWAHVRAAFDYPVFTAAPEHAGITATGDTGEHVPNDFPAVLTAWREFNAWVRAGAVEKLMPQFADAPAR